MFNKLICLTSVTLLSLYTNADSDYIPRPERSGQELILCRKCGADIADTNYLFSKASHSATKTETRKLFGKQNLTVQTLTNPHGIQFEIITLEKARCENIGLDQSADSWFLGYTWRFCACQQCGQHLGWSFQRTEHEHTHKDSLNDQISSFNALILKNILEENYTDFLMIPKMYKM